MDEPLVVHDEDAFQALIMAIEGIRWTMDRSGLEFSWLTSKRGDHFFPRFIDFGGWGVAFRSKLERMVDREAGRHARAIIKRHTRKLGPRRRSSVRAPKRSAPAGK
jgi:hypothetical protein